MIVSVEIPDQFAKQFHLDEAARSRELFEAFVLQRFAEGELTSGQVGAAASPEDQVPRRPSSTIIPSGRSRRSVWAGYGRRSATAARR